MAISEFNRKIVRTRDGIQYEIESDEPHSVRRAQIGEYVDARGTISDYIQEVAESLRSAFLGTGAGKASVTFGVSLSSSGAFFITQGNSDAHVVITLEYSRDASGTYNPGL